MSRYLRLLCLVILLVVAMPATAQDDDPLAIMDAMLTTLAERDNISASVLIAQDGEVLLSKGYGYADREWAIPNAPDTVFRIGSITKQFTAMGILRLHEDGLLTVDDPICQHLEECPDAWADITIHHLLTHTSGIPNFTEFRDYRDLAPFPSRPDQTIERFINEPLDFEPGTDFHYSNSGYILLGKIIDEVAGRQTYAAFLNATFFEPLGMTDTRMDSNSAIIERRAEGYRDNRTPASYIDMSIPFAAGALVSTVEDLLIWTEALHSGQVVSAESWEMMLERAHTFPDGTQYGYGLNINRVAEHPHIGHGGGIEGFASNLVYFTEAHVTVIVLSNFQDAASAWTTIETYVGRLLEAG